MKQLRTFDSALDRRNQGLHHSPICHFVLRLQSTFVVAAGNL